MDDNAVTHNSHLRISRNLAVRDVAAGNGADAAHLEGIAHLGMTEYILHKLGRKHTLHCRLYLLYCLIDYAVETNVHIVALCRIHSRRRRAHIETDNDRIGRRREHYIGLGYSAHTAVDAVYADFLVAQLGQRLLDSLDRTHNIGFHNDVEVLHLSGVYLAEQIVKADHAARLYRFFFNLLFSLFDNRSCLLLVVNHIECVAAVRHGRQTDYLNRHGRTGFLYLVAAVVHHCPDMTDTCAGDDEISRAQSTVLHKHRRNRTSALVQARLYDGSLCLAVWVCLEFLHVCHKQNHLKQFLYVLPELCGDVHKYRVAAPLLGDEIVLGQFLFDFVGVCSLFVYLVYRHDYGDAGSLGVVYCLYGLRHYAVVRRNNQYCDIRNLSTAHTHSRECLVSRGVEEGYLPVVHPYPVSTDVLSYAACLFCNDISLSYGVEQ